MVIQSSTFKNQTKKNDTSFSDEFQELRSFDTPPSHGVDGLKGAKMSNNEDVANETVQNLLEISILNPNLSLAFCFQAFCGLRKHEMVELCGQVNSRA